MTALATVASLDHAISVVARRRVPEMHVIDPRGHVVLSASAAGQPSAATREIALKLIAQHPSDRVVIGLTAPEALMRLVRLDGHVVPHYALFIEPFSTRSPIDDATTRFALSDREREVLRALLCGASSSEIADDLAIAESTVATHVRNIGAKMNASKRREIVATVLGRC